MNKFIIMKLASCVLTIDLDVTQDFDVSEDCNTCKYDSACTRIASAFDDVHAMYNDDGTLKE